VKDVLQTLLSISPTDVFSVMVDDCRGSEEETGASRRNIVEYLRSDAVDVRKRVLESGDNLEAEKVFREGFLDVLRRTAVAESRVILEILIPLSTVSGRNATRETMEAFLRALSRAIPSLSTAEPFIRIFDDFLGRDPALDSISPFRFLADHGGAVVRMAIAEDPAGVRIVERLRRWTVEAVENLNDGDKEFVTAFSKTVLDVLIVRLHCHQR
jgi:hypothetical protein